MKHNENRLSSVASTCLMTMQEVHGIFSDGVVVDNNQRPVFLSIWGRDTAVQELLARLSVVERDGGLESATLTGSESQACEARTIHIHFGNVDRFDKLTGRMPKTNLFGSVSQVWLYDHMTVEPDRANRKAILLSRLLNPDKESGSEETARLWQLICQTCHLPLLNHWRDTVMEAFSQNGFIQPLFGIGLNGTLIDLGSDDVDQVIGDLIQSEKLSLD